MATDGKGGEKMSNEDEIDKPRVGRSEAVNADRDLQIINLTLSRDTCLTAAGQLKSQIDDLRDRVAVYQRCIDTPKKELMRERDDARRELDIVKKQVIEAEKRGYQSALNMIRGRREALADLCHRQWSGWMEYLFSKCIRVENRAYMAIPVWAEGRWRRQASTKYDDLTSSEQDSDREEADKFIEILGAGKSDGGENEIPH